MLSRLLSFDPTVKPTNNNNKSTKKITFSLPALSTSPTSSSSNSKQQQLPTSLPKNWPNPTNTDILERPTRIITLATSTPQKFSFGGNFIKTSKFTALNFVPKFLALSFHPSKKMANVYFLIVACMQTIPLITNTMGLPTVMIPLSFVILVDGVFSALEDYARHDADDRANASKTHVFNTLTLEFEEVEWASIKVGDYVKIFNREVIPADVMIVAVKEKEEGRPQGRVYVETKSLDGETNLKMRRAMKCTMALIKTGSDVERLMNGEIEMEHPNRLIDSFRGTIELTTTASSSSSSSSDLKDDTSTSTSTSSAPKVSREVISTSNILLRGCTVRNVDWCIGLALNTGLDTKIMMTNTTQPPKTSSLERIINVQIKRIVFYLCLVCAMGALGAYLWNVQKLDYAWYMNYHNDVDFYTKVSVLSANTNQTNERERSSSGDYSLYFWNAVAQFFYYFLLMANFVPVSLYVSMSTVKYFQGTFIESDLKIYHAENDAPTRVRTMALNEELGQVSHIFSDKTGTLTCNIMDFRKCSINGVSYGKGITEIGKAAFSLSGDVIPPEDLAGEELAREHAMMHKQPHVNWYDQSIRFDLVGASGDVQANKLGDFFTILALCHSVIPEHIEETGEIRLSASSPDDEALVCGAKFFGFEFVDRSSGSATLRLANGEDKMYDILEMIEFNSTRKRMSVVVRNGVNVELYCKGADTVMLPLLKPNQDKIIADTCEHMTNFAKEGLRTLMICSKSIDPEWFVLWHARYNAACTDLNEIEKRLDNQPNNIDSIAEELERNLTLLGASAIEDKLQEGVPECIADLTKAGIKIWVLTGDKVETAINIAVACRLLQPEEYMEQVVIGGFEFHKKVKLIEKLSSTIREYEEDVIANGDAITVKPRALIIDGPALLTAMEDDVQPYLLRFTQCCKAVIACRVSPDQKRLMVQMVREKVAGVKTLAIGDGANDVAMIQAAHVGIGISGMEGMQAVNASDYAIGQFKFLRRLLLVHGRWNYRRMAKLVCYVFYKNIVMAIVQFWYAFNNGFSGQKFYFEGGIQLFNILYTCFPIMLLGIFEQDVDEHLLLKYPQLYNNGIRDVFFNTKVFGSWILLGTIESLIISVVPLYLMDHSSSFITSDGTTLSIWHYGATSFTLVIIVTNVKLLLNQYLFPWFSVITWICSVCSWFLTAWGMTEVIRIDYSGYKVFADLVCMPSYWLTIVVVLVMIGMRDFFYKGYQRAFHPQLHHVLQEISKFNLPYNKLIVPNPPTPVMCMKTRMSDLPEVSSANPNDSEDIQLLQRLHRASMTVTEGLLNSLNFKSSLGLGFAYTQSDLVTVQEERKMVLGIGSGGGHHSVSGSGGWSGGGRKVGFGRGSNNASASAGRSGMDKGLGKIHSVEFGGEGISFSGDDSEDEDDYDDYDDFEFASDDEGGGDKDGEVRGGQVVVRKDSIDHDGWSVEM